MAWWSRRRSGRGYGGYGYGGFAPYVPVAQRQANAAKEVAKLLKKGQKVLPVKIAGRKIAQTFWGDSWCKNLERYSDLANRLPRGRTYVRNGSVVHLEIKPGEVAALVSGSSLYEIKITIAALPSAAWKAIGGRCAGQIASVIELLSGKLSKGVMAIITEPGEGLFPKPAEIRMECSCPDGAYMCKHLAAVLYGVGARLDDQPELLFVLRKVNHLDLIKEADLSAVTGGAAGRGAGAGGLAESELGDVFGIELETGASERAPEARPAGKAKKPARRAAKLTKKAKKPVAKKAARRAAGGKGARSGQGGH
ncbi:MAG TPA: SWIM zinc finger family protein [Phycisphaerae bacterium]|nr:SWIM zinc finger family protein [Phycisphaerae bacterium]